MASTPADINAEPLGPVNFSHCRSYHFSIEPFRPLCREVKTPGLFRTREDITLDLQTISNSVYDVGRKTLERNLTCPKCNGQPDEDEKGHKVNMSTNSQWVAYMKLHKNREVGLLDAKSTTDAGVDFIFLEDRYLEYDKGSKCKGLD